MGIGNSFGREFYSKKGFFELFWKVHDRKKVFQLEHSFLWRRQGILIEL